MGKKLKNNKKMKYFLTFISFLIFSCGGDSKRNADLVVKYDNKIVYTAYGNYNTESDLKNALQDDKKPDFIIFSSKYCSSCELLQNTINDLGYREHVILLNLQEYWVSFIANSMGIDKIPAMIVTSDSGKSQTPIIFGPSKIVRELYKHLELKK
tara:strand:- start:719 stop:1180 length:462 start_codon:yes stop_codon:yes gene_type:complete